MFLEFEEKRLDLLTFEIKATQASNFPANEEHIQTLSGSTQFVMKYPRLVLGMNI